jgi:hypothetical protein
VPALALPCPGSVDKLGTAGGATPSLAFSLLSVEWLSLPGLSLPGLSLPGDDGVLDCGGLCWYGELYCW